MRTRPPTPPRRRDGRTAAALAALLAGASAATLVCGCTASPTPTLTAVRSAAATSGPAVSSTPAGASTPSPAATITAGPVPPAAARTALRYWRLVGAHRYRALLAVVTRDSQAAAALRAGDAVAFWGIERVRVVSIDHTVSPLPPPGATLEFAMTVAIRPARAAAWSAGRTLVFMCLRRAGGCWLVYEAGTGP